MDLNAFFLVLYLSSLFVCPSGVEGGIGLSAREDLELENQLQLRNKPAVKTIHTEYGDMYDCVDFYKQLAFDHPLLMNHSFHFQMKPTLLKRNGDQVPSQVTESLPIGLKGGGCPLGTVPIRRTTKEDLIRERSASSNITSLADNSWGAHYAVVRTRAGAGRFNGAGARLSIYNPRVSGRQYSAARFKLQNGNDVIQVGWRVDPILYGDTRTRQFIRLDAGQSHCFNTRCPGFVLVRSDRPLDGYFEPVTTPGSGLVYEYQVYIQRDLANGNWWLLVGKDSTPVGFWPKRIFSGLADLASYAEWGGEVYSSPPNTLTPAMGSGSFLKKDTFKDAYLSHIEVFNGGGRNVDAYNTETFADKSSSYQVADIEHADELRHLVLYGGPPEKNV